MTVHTILKHVSHVCRDEAEAERDEVFQVLPSAVRVRGGKLEQGHVHEETSHHAAQYIEHQGVFVLVVPRAEAGFGFRPWPWKGLDGRHRPCCVGCTCSGRPTPEGGGAAP